MSKTQTELIQQAAEQQTLLVSRTFAAVAGHFVAGEVFRLQETIDAAPLHPQLSDLSIIDIDGMVVAGISHPVIGRMTKNLAWWTEQRKDSELVAKQMTPDGQLLHLSVTEPIFDKTTGQSGANNAAVVGWARFNFTVPLPKSPLPTLQSHLPSMAKLIGPFFLFTFLAVFIALRQVRAARP